LVERMREPYIEGLATYDDPESCGDARESGAEALTGARMGRVLSPVRKIDHGAPTPFRQAEGHAVRSEYACSGPAPRGRRPLARAEPPSARTGRSTSCPLEWHGGPRWERQGGNPPMHGTGKSDRPIVPTRPRNKAAKAAADGEEGRGLAEGNAAERATYRTQSRRVP
jgi:hypothetical protein